MISPSPEELERERQAIRKAQPPLTEEPRGTVAITLRKTGLRVLILWGGLILMFILIYQFIGPAK